MSALGQKQTLRQVQTVSVLPPKAIPRGMQQAAKSQYRTPPATLCEDRSYLGHLSHIKAASRAASQFIQRLTTIGAENGNAAANRPRGH